MSKPYPDSTPAPGAADAAAAWLGRCDRGLSADEARAFAAWREADPANAREFDQLQREWQRMDLAVADPELAAMARELDVRTAAPRRNYSLRLAWTGTLAAAAAVVLAAVLWWPDAAERNRTTDARPVTYRVVPSSARLLTLADGSVVSLRGDSEITAEFTPSERRVRLRRGEAHFAVAHNPDRPFIVSAGGVAVRAVGTAFDVRLDPQAVEVMVTEGKVRVNDVDGTQSLLTAVPGSTEPPVLVAGQRVVIPAPAAPAPVRVDAVSPAEIERELAWQSTRLVFNRTTLSEAVEAFNRHDNHGHRLVLGTESVGGRLLGGNFRADNADGFVRLIELTADVRAETRDDGTIILWPSR